MAISDDIQNINSAGIRGDYPVAGQDNDTQGFRDNFSLIKENTTYATEALTKLNDQTAKTVENNDFNSFELQNAVLKNVVNVGREGTFNNNDINLDFTENGYRQFYTAESGQVSEQTFIISGLPSLQTIGNVLTGSFVVIIEAHSDTALTVTFKKNSAEFSQDPGTFYVDTITNLTISGTPPNQQADLAIPAGGVGMVEISYIVSTTRTVFIRELGQFTKLDTTLVNG